MRKQQTIAGRRAEDGFTLIEIMIVVVIIGLLAGLVAVNLLGEVDKAKRTAARAQMKSFEQGLDLYKLEVGRYPGTDEGLEILLTGGKTGKPLLKGDRLPKDPWGHDYVYMSPGEGNHPYEIISYGADGQSGGSEDDADVSNWGEGEKD